MSETKAAQDLKPGDRFRERLYREVSVERVEAHPTLASIVCVTVHDDDDVRHVLYLYRVNRRVIL